MLVYRNHSRAYIHHLFEARELLGQVLLYCHNQHQLVRLFDQARASRREGTFSNWMALMLEK